MAIRGGEIIFEYGRICGSNYCNEIEKHFVDIHLHLKNLEREKSQISVGVCSIQSHEEDEGFLVLNGFKSLISLMNENVEDFFVKKEFLSEESTTVIVYSGDSVAKSLDSTPVIVYSGDSVAKSFSFEVLLENTSFKCRSAHSVITIFVLIHFVFNLNSSTY
ncbi:hypothetical protein Avbf_02728 [Armadillidium vulgare]|nr:hypothetical protein Avbf_02728 [Armadillidium vulgare]